jgi:hypothetical protein
MIIDLVLYTCFSFDVDVHFTNFSILEYPFNSVYCNTTIPFPIIILNASELKKINLNIARITPDHYFLLSNPSNKVVKQFAIFCCVE